MKNCIRCRKEFEPKNNRNVYCSKECKHRISDIVCKCVVCGVEFTVGHKKKYCSDACNPHVRIWDKSKRKCPTCKKEYEPKRHIQKYCSRACNPYKEHQKNEFYKSKEWKKIRAEFMAIESNRKCFRCDKPTFAVDHIVRIKDGGTHDLSNLQGLCRHHHQSKSASEGNKNRSI